MVNFTILAGGYSTFIATYLFNSETSTLSLTSQTTTGNNPSWISLGNTPNVLYAVNENEQGSVQSFTVQSNGVVSSPVATVSSGGNSPAHLAQLSSGQVAVFNYGSGNGRVIPTTSDSLHFDDSAPVITFPPPADDISHPHEAVEYKNELLVPDLGGDKIWRLATGNSSKDFKIQGFIEQPASSGPRHISIYGDRLFTLHEVANTLTVQQIPTAPNGTTPIIDNVSILPPTADQPAGAVYGAGEILIPKPTTKFPTPYIYVSNRNVGQGQGNDSIAIFEHVTTPKEGLKLVKQVYTGLTQVRGMVFNKDGDYLVAAGVAGTAGVVVFQRTDGGKNLVPVAKNLEVPTRTSFVWL